MIFSVFFPCKGRSGVDLGLFENVATHDRHVETAVEVLDAELVRLLHNVVGLVFEEKLTFFSFVDGVGEGGLVEGKSLVGE